MHLISHDTPPLSSRNEVRPQSKEKSLATVL